MVTLVALVIVTSFFAHRAADREARNEARSINTVLARSVAQPQLSSGLVSGNLGDLDSFDRKVTQRLLVENVKRVNIWTRSGRIIYSDNFDLIGTKFGLDRAQAAIMRTGGTGEVVLESNAEASDNPTGAPPGTVRIFTRINARDGTPVLFEAFYSLDNIEQRQQEIYQPFRYIIVIALAVLLILVTPIIWVLTRDLTRAGVERERLLQAGLDASDAERRRIARDLHDGVVQDLAGTSYGLAALARDKSLPERVQTSMHVANQALRGALTSLRGLLAEIHPPEIQSEGLAAALADLIGPAAAQGVQASLSVEGAETATDEQASLVLRVAQEAARNALRHAQASTLAVTVRSDGRLLVLEVVDDGIGFDTTAPRPRDRYGLTGMTSLVRDRGGLLSVTSEQGEGTTVRLEVDLDG